MLHSSGEWIIRFNFQMRSLTSPAVLKRSSRLLQDEFPELKKRYWGQHLWARGYFCATVGNVMDEIIRNYIANQFTEERNDIFKIEDEF